MHMHYSRPVRTVYNVQEQLIQIPDRSAACRHPDHFVSGHSDQRVRRCHSDEGHHQGSAAAAADACVYNPDACCDSGCFRHYVIFHFKRRITMIKDGARMSTVFHNEKGESFLTLLIHVQLF